MRKARESNRDFSFFLNWLASPRRIGAPLSSSAALADLMTERISRTDLPIVELGVGTGAITRALIRRGVSQHNLTLVEINDVFVRHLRAEFPHANVVRCGVSALKTVFDRQQLRPSIVVSSLPLLSMPHRERRTILQESFDLVGRSGKFYQFSYGPRCPVPASILSDLELVAEHMGTVWFNFPPARVYEISSAASPPASSSPLGR